MDFVDRLQLLCDKRGEKITPILKKLKISTGLNAAWKQGVMPSSRNADKLAQYFDVSVDYLLYGKEISVPTNLETIPSNNVYMIPVFENVSAGFGAYACSDVVDYNPVLITNASDAKDTICIKVTGDSMYPKIEEGDIIVVRKQPSVDSGQLAVVMIDNEEGVVKKVTYGNDWIELISINPMYPPRRFEGADVQRLSVVGLVKQIIKNV